MADEGKIVIELVGKDLATQQFLSSLSQMSSGIKQAESTGTSAFNALNRSIEFFANNWKTLVATIGGGYLISRGMSDFWASFSGNTTAMHELTEMSERLGATVADISGLQFAASRTGVEMDTFNTSITRLTKNISAVNLGVEQGAEELGQYTFATGKVAQALRELGFTTPEQLNALNNMPLKEKLEAIAVAMQKIPSEADKVRYALDLFGKGGGGMVVMLKQGAEGIEQLVQKGTQLGVVIDLDMAEKGAAAYTALKDLKDLWHGFSLDLTNLVAPAITQVVEGLNKKILAVREADPGLQNLTQRVQEFAASWGDEALQALKMGVIGGRIAGLQGAAIGAAAGFMGLTTSLKELSQAMNDPMVLTLFGAALGSRFGQVGAFAGALGGATIGITRGIKKDAAAYQKELAENATGGLGIEEPLWPSDAQTQALEQQILLQNRLDKVLAVQGTPDRAKPAAPGKSGGGGASAADNALQSFIDRMNAETAKAAGDSMATLGSWYQKEAANLDKITAKVGESYEARSALDAAYWSKADKLSDDFSKLMAKESGDAYVEIEAQAAAWLVQFKGIKDKEGNIIDVAGQVQALKERKVWEQQVKETSERLTLEKGYYDTLAGLNPVLAEQLDYKSQALEIEKDLSRYALERDILEKRIPADQADQLRGLLALTNQAKSFNLEKERWAGQGIGGGLRQGAYDLGQTAQTWQATQVADFIKAAPRDISTSMASTFIQGLKTGKADLGQWCTDLGYTVAESLTQKWLEGTLNQIIPALSNGLANLLNGISSGGGGGGGGGLGGWLAGLFGGGSNQVGSGAFYSEMYSGGAYAQGGAFQKFGRGDVLRRPTIFPMATGYGLMAEDGPEAAMPLTRTSDGYLGVRAVGAGGAPQVNVIVNNNAPNTQATTETQPNGDILVTIDQMAAKAYARRGSLYKVINSGGGATKR